MKQTKQHTMKQTNKSAALAVVLSIAGAALVWGIAKIADPNTLYFCAPFALFGTSFLYEAFKPAKK